MNHGVASKRKNEKLRAKSILGRYCRQLTDFLFDEFNSKFNRQREMAML